MASMTANNANETNIASKEYPTEPCSHILYQEKNKKASHIHLVATYYK
jgi:hypothetical protein